AGYGTNCASRLLNLLPGQSKTDSGLRYRRQLSHPRTRRRMALGTDYILDALIREKIDHLFMVPGGLVDPFLPALSRFPNIKPIVAAQEGGAAYMADGYARASGRFGAALAIGGPGLGNMVTAMAAARTDSSRVLIMSGEVAVEMEGLGA